MSFPVAFAAGLAAFFSPCILPLLPTWLAFLGGENNRPKKELLLSLLLFTAGFTLVFTAMGALASGIGQFFFQHRAVLARAGGVLIIIFGLQMLGLFELPFLTRERRLGTTLSRSATGKFLFGVVLALGWTPCTGLILGSIIMLASNSATVYTGMLLLFTYSIGFALPFFFIGLVLGSVPWKKSGGIGRYVQIGAGIILVAMGALLLFNRWSWFQSLFVR